MRRLLSAVLWNVGDWCARHAFLLYDGDVDEVAFGRDGEPYLTLIVSEGDDAERVDPPPGASGRSA